MRRYEFTERGKIILAVLVVVILLVIPATVLALKSAGRTPEPEDNSPSAHSTQQPGSIADESPSESASPSGPVPQSPDPEPIESTNQPSEQPTEQPSEQPAVNPAEQPTDQQQNPPPGQSEKPSGEASSPAPSDTSSDSGLKDPSLDGGVLSFIFTPALQTSLDSKTEALIDDFLKIPDYLPDFQIVTETPKLTEFDTRALMRAVNNALSKQGVKSSQIEHISIPPNASGSFEVKMYFTSKKTK